MAEMPQTGTTQTEMQNPAPDQGTDPRMDAMQGQSIAALQTLVEEQVDAYLKMQGQDGQTISLPEILADDRGAFAAEARELGLTKEYQAFKSQIPQIAALRQELVATAEQLQAGIKNAQGQDTQGQGQNPAQGQDPQAELQKTIEEETAAVKKSGRTGGIVSAILGGVASGFAAFKFASSKGNVFKTAMTALGAAVAGGVGAVVAAKRRAAKSADTIIALQEKLEQAGPMASAPALTPGVDPALDAKAQDLYMKMENAQAEALSPLLDAMMERMTQKGMVYEGQLEQETRQQVNEGIGKFETMLQQEASRQAANGQKPDGAEKSFAAAETSAGSRQEALRAQTLRAQEQGAGVGK